MPAVRMSNITILRFLVQNLQKRLLNDLKLKQCFKGCFSLRRFQQETAIKMSQLWKKMYNKILILRSAGYIISVKYSPYG